MNGYLLIAAIAAAVLSLWLLGEADEMRGQRDAAVTELYQTRLAYTEVQLERVAAERRVELVMEGRESILLAPPEDDGEVAAVTWQALRTADAIGGIE